VKHVPGTLDRGRPAIVLKKIGSDKRQARRSFIIER
jgi:hypothetical protein